MGDGCDITGDKIKFEGVAIGFLDKKDAFAVMREVGALAPIVDLANIGGQFIKRVGVTLIDSKE